MSSFTRLSDGNVKYEWLIKYVLIPGTVLLATLYLARGYRNALLLADELGGSTDLKIQYQQQQYIYKGVNPNYVYEVLRGYPGATVVEIDPTINLPGDGGGYPPWTYFTALFLVPAVSWPVTKVFFAVLNAFSLAMMAWFTYSVTRPYGRLPALGLLTSVLAMGSNSFALGNAQWGLIVNAMLAVMALCLNANRSAGAGLVYGLSLLKPSISAPFFFIFVAQRRWSGIIGAILYITIASLAIWAITTADPVTMLMQWLDARRAGGSAMWRDNWPLDIAWLLGISESITLLVTAIIGLVLSCLLMWANRKSDLVILLAISSVFGYVWTVHFPYDQVMLAFLLIATGHLALRDPTGANAAVFGLVAISLWIPPRASIIVYVEYAQMVIWVFALFFLLYRERQLSRMRLSNK